MIATCSIAMVATIRTIRVNITVLTFVEGKVPSPSHPPHPPPPHSAISIYVKVLHGQGTVRGCGGSLCRGTETLTLNPKPEVVKS